MLLRIPWAYALTAAIGLAVAVGWSRGLLALRARLEGHRAHALIAKLSKWIWITVLILVGVPLALLRASHELWAIDDGSQYRRYLLFGSEEGMIRTLAGEPVRFRIESGHAMSTVVNCTRGRIAIDDIRFGGIPGGTALHQVVRPGESFTLDHRVSGVGEPPRSIEVGSKTLGVTLTFVRPLADEGVGE